MLTAYCRTGLLALALALGGCAASSSNIDYTAFRESKPRSILVLPPLNNSPDVRATYSFLSTVTQPLAEDGYYVFPVVLVDQTFKENGLINAGEIHEVSLAKLREIRSRCDPLHYGDPVWPGVHAAEQPDTGFRQRKTYG